VRLLRRFACLNKQDWLLRSTQDLTDNRSYKLSFSENEHKLQWTMGIGLPLCLMARGLVEETVSPDIFDENLDKKPSGTPE